MSGPELRISQIRAAFEIGNGVAGLGDSITASNVQNSTGIIGSSGWLVQSCMRAPDRLRFVRNAGVSGDRTDQMLARMDADLFAYDFDWCFVLGGINDLRQGVSVATVKANLLDIYNRLRNKGKKPIVCTLPPNNFSTVPGQIDQLNAWKRWIASRRGYPLCDFEAVTLDPLTYGWRSGYSDDGLHPNQTGVTAMASQVVNTIAPLMPIAAPFTMKSTATSPVSILTGGLFLTDANADGVADGWTPVNTSVNATPSIVTDATSGFGKWQRLTVTTSGQKYFERNAGSGWSVGDRIAFVGKVSTSGAIAGSAKITAKVLFKDATGTPNQLVPIYQLTNDVTNWGFYQEGVIPTGTTALAVQLMVESGTVIVDWREIGILNMTTQGLVS